MEAVTRRSFAAEYISFVSASIKSASWLCGIVGVSVRLKPLVQSRPLQDPSFSHISKTVTHLSLAFRLVNAGILGELRCCSWQFFL